jgi:hypothetical protein
MSSYVRRQATPIVANEGKERIERGVGGTATPLNFIT